MACAQTAAGGRPLVSIVVPFHNSAAYAQRCIASLLAQEASGIAHEIIAVDSVSSDGTLACLRGFEPRIRVVASMLKGASAARNAGVLRATGRYIAFMDGDCVADPDWLAAFVRAAQQMQDSVILGGPILANDTTHPVSVFAQNLYDQQAAVTSERLAYAITCNMFVARTVLVDAGLFDEALLRGQDVDFSWRAARICAAQFRFVPDAIVFHDNPRTLGALFAKGLQHGRGMACLSLRHGEATGLTHMRRIRNLRLWRRILRDLWQFVAGAGDRGADPTPPRATHLYWAVFNTGKQIACVFHSARYLLGGGR
jgi:GT2 family glycosyltransferase